MIRDQVHRFQQLYRLGQTITSEMNLDRLFQLIMNQTNQIMQSERSSVFLHDPETKELWSLVATGMGKDIIRIDDRSGIAGWVFQQSKPLIINDPYHDRRFNQEIDDRSGYLTRNILGIPVINRQGQTIGVLEVLNKLEGAFERADIDFLKSISDYVAIALENAKLYADTKRYSEKLEKAIIRSENLEKIKNRLSRFVPGTVAKLAEQNPESLGAEKVCTPVSVLFIDIQGYSHITEHHDQRAVNTMIERHFSAYLDCINQHGGELNETSGDGLMVIYKSGAEADYVDQAVRTGLNIIHENERLNQAHAYPWGAVKLHLGINTGEAYVGATRMKSITGERWTYTASGMVTVIAARLGALSSDSRLLVGPNTYQRIRHRYHCRSMGEKVLKNVSRPLRVYQVLGTK